MDVQGCQECGAPLSRDALACSACGNPIEPDATKRLGPITSIIGALFLGAGPFFPWLVYKLEAVSGVAETRKKALILAGLAVFAIMFSLSSMTGKRFTGLRGNISAGLVAVGISIYFYIETSSLVGGAPTDPHLGPGIYFCLAGAVIVLIGGVLTRSAKSRF